MSGVGILGVGLADVRERLEEVEAKLEAAIERVRGDARALHGLKTRLEVIEDARAKSSTLNITGLVNRVRDIERAMLEADTSLGSRIETLEARDVCIGKRVSDLEAAAPKPDPKPADCPWCGSEAWQQGGGSEEGMGPAYWVVCSEDLCDACGPLRPSAQEAIAAWNKVAAK